MAFAAPLAIAATLASGAISAYGQMEQGKAAQQSGLYQAAVARNNKIIAERAAEAEKMQGLSESEQNDYKVRSVAGTQKAIQAANGIDVNSGTALAIRKGTVEMGTYDSEMIRANAGKKAYNYLVQAQNFESEARFKTMEGDNARRASKIAAFGTLVGTAGSVASKWKGLYG